MAGTTARIATRPHHPNDASKTPEVSDLVDEAASTETAWWRTVAIGGAALVSAIAFLVLVWLLAKPLALLLAAIVIAAALSPIIQLLERWMSRALAVIALYLGLIILIAAASWFFGPPLIAQGREVVERAPDIINKGRTWMNRFDPIGGDRMITAAESGVTGFSDRLIALPLQAFSTIIQVVLVLFMSAYWLISGPPLHRFFLSLFPRERRDKADSIIDEMNGTMGGYIRATILNGFAVAAMVYVGLLVIGVDYPILLALLAGAGEFIPILGPILASVPAIAVALLDSPTQALIVAAFYLVLQQVESNLLVPGMMRNQADIPPLLSLVALFAGSALGGLLGALVAIPLAGALRILVVRVLTPAEQEWVGSDGAPPPA